MKYGTHGAREKHKEKKEKARSVSYVTLLCYFQKSQYAPASGPS